MSLRPVNRINFGGLNIQRNATDVEAHVATQMRSVNNDAAGAVRIAIIVFALLGALATSAERE